MALLLLWASATPAVRALPSEPERAPLTSGSATVGPFTFALGPYEIHELPIERLYYNGASIVDSCGLTDAAGVAMLRASDGTIYNHPGAQARCALNMQRNYRLDPDPAYLEQAAANAQRIVSLAVSHGGGSFYPVPFTWNNAARGTMKPPWYSAMIQGQALSAFVRLYEWTGEARWRTAADAAFRSFLVKRQSGMPWVVGVENGRLWLDEYPSTPLDRVFNGHNFAMYGLYDYWRLTGNAQARLLALGAIHSSYLAAASEVRDPGGISFYCVSAICLSKRIKNPAYHPTHAGQLMRLYHVTRHWHFASLMEAFLHDSPFKSSGQARLAAGAHDAYTFDSDGVGTRVATVTLGGVTIYDYSRREVPGAVVRPGNGVWLMISEGPLSGRWIRESSRAFPLGFVDNELDAYIPRPILVEAGTYVGRTFDSAGNVTGSVTVDAPAATWTYRQLARINGRPSVLPVTGPLSGRWVTLDPRLLRDATLFTDVDGSAFRQDIVWLTDHDITRGCQRYAFCPIDPVTREQMAAFLVRALSLPPASQDYFTDDEGSVHEPDINRVAAAGITLGCAAGRFCPLDLVRRDQMASFIARALDLADAPTDYFADDQGSVHEPDINRLAAAGITLGCGADRYCPAQIVKREQMAAFLRRALSPSARLQPPQPLLAPEPSVASTPTPTPTGSPSPTPSPVETPTPSPTPAATPTPTPAPTAAPSPSPTIGSEP